MLPTMTSPVQIPRHSSITGASGPLSAGVRDAECRALATALARRDMPSSRVHRFYERRPQNAIIESPTNLSTPVFLHRGGLQTKVPVQQRDHEQRSQPSDKFVNPTKSINSTVISRRHGHRLCARFCDCVPEFVDRYTFRICFRCSLGAIPLRKIEGIGQSALIRRTHRQLNVEIALLHIEHSTGQRPHGPAKTVGVICHCHT